MMEKRSALSRLWLSAFLVWAGPVYSDSLSGEFLTQKQLTKPEVITKWLQDNPEGVDKKGAAFSFDEGLKYKRRKYWSAAAKSFGESAIRYPSPQVLTEYAMANLYMLGEIRTQKGNTQLGVEADINYAIMQYRSVMAADKTLNALSEAEKIQIKENIECLTDYLKTRRASRECQPLKYYGLAP
ncbi:hypothetical protein RAS12_08320 [Achromobacter seleniivolatilans]|uniref:Uncharacterized protein n=1 Tax=Achromobacter seleniivolatilans TaxID=3047478 RepID=A0ABY9M720_9BURK|nr:hypothetical protein [Achromobacter sp. R39]WMD22369.1 hypothetical protein RAS12_08320 [Achromobacter sp. R39]